MTISDMIAAIAVVVAFSALAFGIYRYFWPRVAFTADMTKFATGVVGVSWIQCDITLYNRGKVKVAIREAVIADASKKPPSYCSGLQNYDIPLPVSLEVGDHWTGSVDTELPDLPIDAFRVRIIHSESEKPYHCKIRERLDPFLEEIDSL